MALIMFLVGNQRGDILKPLFAFLHSIKLSGYEVGIKFDRDPWAVEQSNYATKIVNAYIVYDLDAWPRNPIINSKFKNYLFGATGIATYREKEKWVYSGYWITFNGTDSYNFGNNAFARNVVLFRLDNSSSSHTNNRNNNPLVLGEGPAFGIVGSFGSPDKKDSISFSKARTRFYLSLHYNDDNSYLFVNGKKIFKFKANNKNVNFPIPFCLWSISSGVGVTDSRELSLKGNVYDFSVDYSTIDKSDISKVQKYLK